MSSPGRLGESSSCKRQENGDKATESERPLKKARFAWQVKGRGRGKYNLKPEESPLEKCTTSSKNTCTDSGDESTSKCSSDTENDTEDIVGNTEQNLEILGDYLLKQDFNTLDSVITDCDKTKPSSSPTEKSFPRYVVYDNNGKNVPSTAPTSAHEKENTPVPVSLVSQTSNTSEDQYIARWQARQMAKGFVDNTINRVLDSWLVAPLPVNMESNRYLALDVAEFINNLPGNNSIENEGILMAISAHGLQNTSSSSRSSYDDNHGHTIDENCSRRSSHSSENDTDIDDATSVDNNYSYGNDAKPPECEPPAWQSLDSPCICSHTMRSSLSSGEIRPTIPFHQRDPRNPYAYLPGSVTSAAVSNSDIKDSAKGGSLPESSHADRSDNQLPVLSSDDVFTNNFDFMDAAVSFAIQNKGLASFGTEYG